MPMRSYGQFCPVAKAAEIFAERWTPLIVRELACDSYRFNELERGLPGISRSLLSQRLRSLERAGIVERQFGTTNRAVRYRLTPAGQELSDVVLLLGEWGQRWVNSEISLDELDPTLLMWDVHRRINVPLLPDRRVVAQFDFIGARRQSIWLILERPEPSVCFKDPGFDVDLFITADTMALHRVWIGHMSYANALRAGLIDVDGPSELTRSLPAWLALSMFAPFSTAHPPTTGRAPTGERREAERALTSRSGHR